MADRFTGSVRVGVSAFGLRADYLPLLMLVGDARFTLLGEASHGDMSSITSAPKSPSASYLNFYGFGLYSLFSFHGGCGSHP